MTGRITTRLGQWLLLQRFLRQFHRLSLRLFLPLSPYFSVSFVWYSMGGRVCYCGSFCSFACFFYVARRRNDSLSLQIYVQSSPGSIMKIHLLKRHIVSVRLVRTMVLDVV